MCQTGLVFYVPFPPPCTKEATRERQPQKFLSPNPSPSAIPRSGIQKRARIPIPSDERTRRSRLLLIAHPTAKQRRHREIARLANGQGRKGGCSKLRVVVLYKTGLVSREEPEKKEGGKTAEFAGRRDVCKIPFEKRNKKKFGGDGMCLCREEDLWFLRPADERVWCQA